MPTEILPEQNLPADQMPADSLPPTPAPPRKSWTKWLPLLLLFLLLYIALNVWIYLYGTRVFGTKVGNIASQVSIVKPPPPTPTPTPTPKITLKLTPTPTPTRLYPDDGVKGTYIVSGGKHSGPNESKIIFDPLDVQKGQKLTVTVTLTGTAPIQSVTGVFETDHGSQNVVFSRISGTDLNGEWQTSITLQDSVFYTYAMKVTATSANGTDTAITAPR